MRKTIWDIDPHTEAKLAILRNYLGAWFPIMATYARLSGGNRLVYIDGFAGPGSQRYSNESPEWKTAAYL